MIELLEKLVDPLRIGLTVLAVAAFIAIVAWTLLRPQKQVDSDASLWKDEQVPSARRDESGPTA